VRNIVLSLACALPQPFTAEQLQRACETERISVGTVYNSLNTFMEAQVFRATERQRGKAATEYELITGSSNRLQIVCKKCGRVTDITDKAITTLVQDRKYSNFNMQHFSLFIYGECRICRKKKIKTKA
jgi:Fur family ferric uptake transcriptional regulator